MKQAIIIIGMGEMAGVFSRGLLKLGHPVFPVTRDMDVASLADAMRDPLLVLVTVAENDLRAVLDTLPAVWRDRVGLVQNELLPRDWQAHGIVRPTVIAVWFEKKKGRDVRVLVPSPVHGPGAQILADACARLDIPTQILRSDDELLFELVRKNVYILTTNIAGMVVGGNVETLWNQHQALAVEVANEVMDIQFALIRTTLDREKLIAGMVAGINGDRAHQCMGRSAPARLARAIAHADAYHLLVPRLRTVAATH